MIEKRGTNGKGREDTKERTLSMGNIDQMRKEEKGRE